MLKRPYVVLGGCWLAGALASGTLMASEETAEQASQSVEAQQAQAAIQQQIDAADEQTQAMLDELRRLEQETQQMAAANAATSARLASEAERQQRLDEALDTLSDTRAALPVVAQDMSEQLSRWINSDLPFLRDERLARVQLDDASGSSSAEQIEQLLQAWRSELAYGREIDSWRGQMQSDSDEPPKEVEYLRIGRIGFYYLTADGREGGVWDGEADTWQSLDEGQRREVRHGLRMADDQRTPDMLRLPLSVKAARKEGAQ